MGKSNILSCEVKHCKKINREIKEVEHCQTRCVRVTKMPPQQPWPQWPWLLT